jgi:uracil-DNA glycosylase
MSEISNYAASRSLADTDVLAERITALDASHMTALNNLVADLRRDHGDVPWFDPFDGGSDARLLVVMETPGPSMAAVRFTSRDNATGTARNLRGFFEAAGIDRRDTALWNAVPWVIPRRDGRMRPPTLREAAVARAWIPALLARLPRLRAILLAGRVAGLAEPAFREAAPECAILRIPHPSPTNLAVEPARRVACLDGFRQAAASIGLLPGEPQATPSSLINP